MAKCRKRKENAKRSGGVRGGEEIFEVGLRKDFDLSIQVDVNGMTDGEEEETHGSTATIVCQVVVVEKTVVDALTGGTVLVDLLELSRVPGNRRIETDVIRSLDIEAAASFGRGADPNAGAG